MCEKDHGKTVSIEARFPASGALVAACDCCCAFFFLDSATCLFFFFFSGALSRLTKVFVHVQTSHSLFSRRPAQACFVRQMPSNSCDYRNSVVVPNFQRRPLKQRCHIRSRMCLTYDRLKLIDRETVITSTCVHVPALERFPATGICDTSGATYHLLPGKPVGRATSFKTCCCRNATNGGPAEQVLYIWG